MANELADSAKTIRLPDRMPRTACGNTTRRSAVRRDAPSVNAAASTEGSSFCNTVQTGITMKGA